MALSLQKIGGGRTAAGVLLAAALAGCAAEASFDSPESAARLRAIQRAAAEDDRSSIPRLIEMLESDDAAVRLLSIRTLESMTGQTLGYDAAAPSYQRAESIQRWVEWYDATRAGQGDAGIGNASPFYQNPNEPSPAPSDRGQERHRSSFKDVSGKGTIASRFSPAARPADPSSPDRRMKDAAGLVRIPIATPGAPGAVV